MVQKLSYTANSITLGTGTSKVVLGADSGNLIVKDSDANTSIIEPGTGVQGASAVATYANPAALPFSPISSAGSLAYTTSTGALYMSNGSGWYKITLVNTAPSITLSSTTASPTATNLTLDFTYTVTEPEGTPTTVTLANSGIATVGNVAITHTTSNNHVRLVFDGTTKYSGDASVTLSVTDGVNTGAGAITISTAYYESTNSRFNSLIMKATGTGNNDTYDDASASNHTVNKNGTVEQLSFSPYRDNGYSVFFDGTGDYLTTPDSSDFNFATGNGDFTIESWIYKTNASESGWYSQRDTSTTELMIFLDHNISGYSAGSVSIEYDSAQYTFDADIVQNKWQHIALVRTGTTVKWFTDGIEKDSRSEPASLANYGHTVYIGTWRNLSRYFKGYISDFRIVNGTAVYTSNFDPPTQRLPAVTNTKLLIGGNGFRDISSSAHTITASGDTKMEAFSPYDRQDRYTIATGGGSAYFNNGDSDYLEIPASADHQIYGGNYTVEAWLYPTAFNSENAVFLSKGTASAREYHFSIHSSNFQVYWSTDGGSSGSTTRNFSTSNNLNEWIHVAITKSSNTITVYKNGVSLGTGTFTSIHSTNNVTTVGRLWQYTGINHQFRGYISNLRIVKGSVVYSGNFTPPTSPVTAITNTKLLLNSTDSKIYDSSQSVKRLTLVNGAVASSTQHFGENTVEFPGSSDYIKIEQQPFIAGETFTIEGWHNLDARTNYSPCLFNNYTSHTTGSLALFAGHGSSTTTQYQLSQNGVFPAFNAGTVAYNQWVHFAVQRNLSENIQVYIDGTQIGSDLASTMALPGIGNDFYIGTAGDTLSAGSIDGHLHDFRISKGLTRFPFVPLKQTLTTTNSQRSGVTVTASNVTLLTCHAASITDGSSNSTSITTNGNAAVSNFGPGPGMKSVYFDGTGDYLQCTLADTLGTADWTVEYWVYHNGISGNQIHCAFNGYAPAFYRRNSSNAFAVYHNPGISGNHNANITPVTGKWYHMAYCHDDSENKMAVFANGSLVDEFAYTGNINGTTFRIGDDGTSAWMNGYISNLRIVKNTVVYSKTFTPTTSALQ